MAVTTPILGGTTLPQCSEYDEEFDYRGVTTEMADGSELIDLVSATGKHVFSLGWQNITATQKGTVETGFATIKTAYTASNFTSPNGSVYTVTRGSGLSWSAAHSAGNLVYSTRSPLVLREV